MRKFMSVALGTAMLLASVFPLVACAKSKCKRASYNIEGEYFPEERKLSARMSVHAPNCTENVLTELKFALHPNAFREGAKNKPVDKAYESAVYYKGASYGGIEITGIEGAKSFSVTGEDCNILSVTVDELYPDECADLTLSFEATLPEINHRFGVGEKCVNLTGFYPVLCAFADGKYLEYPYASNGDPFVNECADYTVSLTVPAKYTAAYGGEGEVTEQGDKKTYRVTAESAREVAFVLGEFECVKGSAAGADIEYYYFKDENPQEALKAAEESLAYFSDMFGEYPYSKYTVVETDFPYGGMEYSGLSLISSALREGERVPVVVHETAHQWWYSLVGSNQFEHAWQDEGLAEYSAALFFDAHSQYGITCRDFVETSESAYRAFYSVYSQVKGEADTRMSRPLTSYENGYEYRNLAYDKGVIMFDRVRSTIGERRFFSALKRYCSEYAGKIASPEDLIGCFERTGANVEGLFASFLEGRCVI